MSRAIALWHPPFNAAPFCSPANLIKVHHAALHRPLHQDVLGDNGQIREVCQSTIEVDAGNAGEAERKAEERFCDIHATHDSVSSCGPSKGGPSRFPILITIRAATAAAADGHLNPCENAPWVRGTIEFNSNCVHIKYIHTPGSCVNRIKRRPRMHRKTNLPWSLSHAKGKSGKQLPSLLEASRLHYWAIWPIATRCMGLMSDAAPGPYRFAIRCRAP